MIRWIQKSIRTKIVMTVFLCIIVFAAIACPGILLTIQSIHERHLATQAEIIGRGSQSILEDRKGALTGYVERLAKTEELGKGLAKKDGESVQAYLVGQADKDASDFYILTDADGKLITQTLENPVSQEAIDGLGLVPQVAGGSIASGVESFGGDLFALCAAVPVYSGTEGTGELAGILIGGFDLSNPRLSEQMQEIYQVESGLFFKGELVSSVSMGNEFLPGTSVETTLWDKLEAGQPYIVKEKFMGRTLQSVYQPITDSNGKIQGVFYNGIDRTEDDRSVMVFIIVLLFGICVLCIIALWMIDRVVRGISLRVNSMVAYANDISTGDMSETIQVKGNDEVASLGNAFAGMIDGIRGQVQVVEKMAEGDFSVSIPVRGEKDVMGKSMQKMLDNLNEMLDSIGNATAHVTDGSRQISDGAQYLAGASGQQAHAVETLSDSIDTITKLMEDNEKKMSEAAFLTSEVADLATEGSLKMTRMTEAVMDIDNASEEIRKIMKVIEEVDCKMKLDT